MELSPLVTVIMTVYNGELHLAEAIESIRAQSLQAWELNVVNDGSTDGTAEILGAQADQDDRIRVIGSGRVGRAKALNLAWRCGSAPYVANLDADDLCIPERLERQLHFMQANPEVGVAGSMSKRLRNGHLIDPGMHNPQTDAEIRRAMARTNPIVHTSVIMRREILEAVGGYDESYRVAIDYDLWERMAHHTKLANLSEALVIRRFHDNRFFRTQIPFFTRVSANIAVRWRAWRHFSRRPSDLYHVFIGSTVKGMRIRIGVVPNRRTRNII